MDDQAVIVSVIIVVGSTLIRETVEPNGHPSMRPVLGGFLLGAALFAIASVSPDIAKGLAVLVSTTALIVNGAAVFPAIGKVVTA